MGRVNRGEKDLRGQIGRSLAIADPTGDETLQILEVLAVEGIEEVGVGPNPGQLLGANPVFAGSNHAQVATERARWFGQGSLCLHSPLMVMGEESVTGST